jgi:uncharacterized protein (DUF305 family)
MLRTILVAASLATAISLSSMAIAQEHDAHGAHQGHSMMDDSPSSKAFQAANEKMHKDMAVPLTGNADVDFVRGMIPHHQGAIDMAKIVLAHGKDPEIRKLAEEVIKAQEGEIAMMKEWLAKNGQ